MAHVLGEARMHTRTAAHRRKSVGNASMLNSSSGARSINLGNPPASGPSFSRESSSNGGGSVDSTASSSATNGTHRGSLARNGHGNITTPNLIDLKTITAEEVEWEGYLYKQRKIVKNWTPRYITLQNRTVTVYKSKTHAIAKEQNRGKWVVHQILTTLPSTGFGGSKLQPDLMGFSFLATNGNMIHFIAPSAIQKAMWLHAMRHALQRANAETASLLRPSLARGGSATSTSTSTTSTSTAPSSSFASVPSSTLSRIGSGINFSRSQSGEDQDAGFESTITKVLADKFLADMMQMLSTKNNESVTEQLPTFMHQLAKDVELWFDLETSEQAQPSCVFKGVYHGREGFVQFIALFVTKYLLNSEPDGDIHHRAEDDDHHGYACMHHLINTVSGSKTLGKFALQLSFTPAKRVSRAVLSFRQRPAPGSGSSSSSSSSSKKVRRSVQANPIIMSEHAACFYQAFLSKRSLAMSFSDFDVVGVLGQGGFGTVVLVKRHLSQDEYFAIKIIDKHSGAESALKERRILSGMRHPFLACLRFAFQTQTKLYLGLDYYKGGNLYLHMHTSKMDPNISTSAGRRFGLEQARFYAAELAIALSYLHAHGIIYRDLKPDNIMLDRFGHIRLVDFGISKQLRSNESGSGQYEPTSTLAGSPAYIAPEQLLTQKPQYGMEADWWSYGVLLYEMLTGSTPFHDGNISQMYKKIQTADVKYDRTPAIDEDAVDLLKKLLVRDPAERIGVDEIMSHAFFKSIDWARLEVKDVEAPFIPPADDLMANVHDHFRNMKVEESIGEMDVKTGKKNTTLLNLKDESHFDEFSFAYDTTRATFDGLSMADDGWLMRQLAEGAALRGRLQSTADEVEALCLDDQTSEEDGHGSGSGGANPTRTLKPQDSGSQSLSGSDGDENAPTPHSIALSRESSAASTMTREL